MRRHQFSIGPLVLVGVALIWAVCAGPSTPAPRVRAPLAKSDWSRAIKPVPESLRPIIELERGLQRMVLH